MNTSGFGAYQKTNRDFATVKDLLSLTLTLEKLPNILIQYNLLKTYYIQDPLRFAKIKTRFWFLQGIHDLVTYWVTNHYTNDSTV